uniref:Uncharacterized protein n=1 Tax=Prolemur simus TaxID=1328070 RepID=A0A8C9A785_PROSS
RRGSCPSGVPGTFHPGGLCQPPPPSSWKHVVSGGRWPHTLGFPSLGGPRGFRLAAWWQSAGDGPKPPPCGPPWGPAGARSHGARDLVPVHTGVLCKHVCAVQRDACGESRTPATCRRCRVVTNVLCLFLVKNFPSFSYKFASCKQVHKDPPLVKSGFKRISQGEEMHLFSDALEQTALAVPTL